MSIAKDELRDILQRICRARIDAAKYLSEAREIEWELIKYLADRRMYSMLNINYTRFKKFLKDERPPLDVSS